MEILYLLIPVVLIGILIALRFLFWAIKSGQYDDLDKEATRILLEDDAIAPSTNATKLPSENNPDQSQ